MALFRRRPRDEKQPIAEAPLPSAEADWSPADDPRLDPDGPLAVILADAQRQVAEAQALADARFGLDRATAWSYDLGAGTIRFEVGAVVVVGEIEVLGTWSSAAESWMWGWANERVDDRFTAASFGVRAAAQQMGVDVLQRPTLRADADDAERLAALAFPFASAEYLFASPTDPVVFVAISRLRVDGD